MTSGSMVARVFESKNNFVFELSFHGTISILCCPPSPPFQFAFLLHCMSVFFFITAIHSA